MTVNFSFDEQHLNSVPSAIYVYSEDPGDLENRRPIFTVKEIYGKIFIQTLDFLLKTHIFNINNFNSIHL
jgi:hypothetical protein